jgi:hypothetical protein
MKKTVITFISLICTLNVFSQKMMTTSGEIKFEASMPAFEEVKALNNSVSCLFNTETGEIASLVLIKGFRFKLPLMEEHFNENYIESDQFPKATFKGKVVNFEMAKLGFTKETFDVEGDLTIRGVTKKVKSKINFIQSGDKLVATSSFIIKVSDFGIKIPSIVKNKIAETVTIDLKFGLEKKK